MHRKTKPVPRRGGKLHVFFNALRTRAPEAGIIISSEGLPVHFFPDGEI
ncbi:hypothetical protein JRG66_13425 [Salinimicrobium tongyeongense]|uniref:Uncharacterized protein n=1 Tax=Salinimicrobium tongyeongense TaxID=2809707 RepID=A0ABY6NPX1_9FLAO|nr:hypothetical protein [Salinimicrobium tongyeongense]UZH54951.1 hypothetical protein JRG66_13425 [Salinimicrobium tongyeongense]